MAGLEDVVEAARAALEGPCGVPPGQGLVAACSGGADSVALVAALAALRDRWPLRAVVFVDHGLRRCDAERAAARDAARAGDAPFVVERVELGLASGVGAGLAANTQARARRARYAALTRVAGADGLVATGHTATDQAETILQRMLRGAGLRGLAGVRPRVGRLVRPLLAVDRATTRGLGLPFADDPSNATDRFQRNRLRALLTSLEGESPGATAALARVAEQVGAELELLDALAHVVSCEHADLTGAPPETAAALVRWRLRREHPRAAPSRAAVAELAARLVRGARSRASLGRGLRGVAAGGRLRFEAERDPRFEVVAHGPGTYRLRAAELRLSEGRPPCAVASGGDAVAWLPKEALRWPLVITERRESGWVAEVETDGVAGRASAPPVDAERRAVVQERSIAVRFVITDALGRQVWPVRSPASVGEHASEEPGLVISLVDRSHHTFVAPEAISVPSRESSDH